VTVHPARRRSILEREDDEALKASAERCLFSGCVADICRGYVEGLSH